MATVVRSAKIGVLAGLLACASNTALSGHADASHRETVNDPTRDYLPAKYYERLAREDMRQQNYAKAVGDYKRAAYWGNKVAQYDLGEIYLRGIGNISADPARAVAWFGIAAETHQPDCNKALVVAYKTLSPEEHERADDLWKELQAVYGDKLTLARATKVFEHAYHNDRASSATTEDDPNTYTFSIEGYDPTRAAINTAALLSELDELSARNGITRQNGYWSSRRQEFAEFITKQFGHVDIGSIEPVATTKEKRTATAKREDSPK